MTEIVMKKFILSVIKITKFSIRNTQEIKMQIMHELTTAILLL